MSIYRGFNTIGQDFGPYKLADNELVLRDFLNHLYIRKGEKLHRPEIGSIIWASLFEPLTPALRDAIVADITRISKYDPRIKAIGRIMVQEYDHGLRLDLQMVFSTNNEVANLAFQFDRESETVSMII